MGAIRHEDLQHLFDRLAGWMDRRGPRRAI
jgi:hypothetical protein